MIYWAVGELLCHDKVKKFLTTENLCVLWGTMHRLCYLHSRAFFTYLTYQSTELKKFLSIFPRCCHRLRITCCWHETCAPTISGQLPPSLKRTANIRHREQLKAEWILGTCSRACWIQSKSWIFLSYRNLTLHTRYVYDTKMIPISKFCWRIPIFILITTLEE